MIGLDAVRRWTRAIKRDVVALYLAGRDPRTPWVAKIVAVAVIAYALSPIDLIPDFLPIVGYLDDLLIVPLGILVAVRLVPSDLMEEFRQEALAQGALPPNTIAAAIIVGIWFVLAAVLFAWLLGYAAA